MLACRRHLAIDGWHDGRHSIDIDRIFLHDGGVGVGGGAAQEARLRGAPPRRRASVTSRRWRGCSPSCELRRELSPTKYSQAAEPAARALLASAEDSPDQLVELERMGHGVVGEGGVLDHRGLAAVRRAVYMLVKERAAAAAVAVAMAMHIAEQERSDQHPAQPSESKLKASDFTTL